jgi:hypothetical protein
MVPPASRGVVLGVDEELRTVPKVSSPPLASPRAPLATLGTVAGWTVAIGEVLDL